jgi:PAS domain S-box-containing protein
MKKGKHSKIRNRLLIWYILGSLLPLIFLVGAVVFYLAPVSSLSEILELVQRTLLIPLLASVILILTLSVFISREITRPISKLQIAVDKLLRGDKNVIVNVDTNDEMSVLAQGFNEMTKEVSSAKAKLEKDIKDRTSALLNSNLELQDSKTAMLNILEDVETSRSRAEAQRTKIEAIIASIDDGVVVMDKNTDILLINNKAREFLYIKDDVVGRALSESITVYKDDGELIKFDIENFLKGKEDIEIYERVVSKKGIEKIYLEVGLSKYKNDSNEILGAIIVVRDITHSVEMDKMKSEFVSVASHQLRTPLSAVRWFLEMLLEGDLGKLNEEQIDVLQDALESNSRMIYLVNDLLNVSRLENAKIRVEPELVSLSKILKIALKEAKVLAKDKKVKINSIGVKEVPKIKLDKALIGQVLQNLISNAIKYSPNNSEVEILLDQIDDDVQFSIKDSGYGVPEKEKSRIFEKFFRAENVTRMETEGTGLGLYISKVAMELSGGKIWFESKEKKGSTFYFSIPLSGSKAKEGVRSLSDVRK